jgi:DNA-binding beta-propeller fold protein YncE
MPPCGTTYKLAISRDAQQKFLYVADGTNNKVWILDRQSGRTLGSFGGNGRYAGQLHWINAIAMDSKGNIYTGEVEQAKRIQKFAPVMASRR